MFFSFLNKFFFFLNKYCIRHDSFTVKNMKKRNRKRRFIPSECNHVYQRSDRGCNIFYDDEDYLLCFMILSVFARKHKIKLLKICFMVDHVHILLEAESCEHMSAFVRDYTSAFVMEYNTSIGRSGRLFYKSFGSAPKQGDKKMRSVIVYIGNNPVEKGMCRYAEEYRWNFIRYMLPRGMQQKKVRANRASRKLLRCFKRVKAAAKSGAYMNYTQLYDMFSDLNEVEREYLVDSIIMAYYPFDDDCILGLYDDWQQVINAMHSTAGSEYDLKEKWYSKSDEIYMKISSYVRDTLKIWPIRNVLKLSFEQKNLLAVELKLNTGASDYEVRKFLHL